MQPILDTLPPEWEVILWDNSEREDKGIYGRYAAIEEASSDLIYVQDDDLLVTCHAELLEAYDGRVLCNYPEPWDIPWVARGAIFQRDAPQKAFERYFAAHPFDRYFTHFACDGIFTLLSECKVVDFGSVDLPHGFDDGRVSTTPGWYDDKRPLIQARCAAL